MTVMEDGVVHIYGPTRENYDAGVESVISTARADVHLDKVYKCVIEAVRDFGCLLQILPSKQRCLILCMKFTQSDDIIQTQCTRSLFCYAMIAEGFSTYRN